MNLVLITHPERSGSASMPRFAGMIANGMRERGHEVELWTPPSRLSGSAFATGELKKWLGYVDDYLLFASEIRRKAKARHEAGIRTLYVFCDQALGMLVPSLADFPHVIHCHDFLAQRSALGEFPENVTGWSGRCYQRLIRRGYRQGNAFISISGATQDDLHRMLGSTPDRSRVVHNGLNFDFRELAEDEARSELQPLMKTNDQSGFLLHVGGNQWYKNRVGAVELYKAYVEQQAETGHAVLPLWMIGQEPTERLAAAARSITGPGEVRFLRCLTNEQVRAAYNLAKALVFPSLEEGFGWPTLEAMACGTPVLTTRKAPMTEVGGDVAFYIDRMDPEEKARWATHGAERLRELLAEPEKEALERKRRGIDRALKFSGVSVIAGYEECYREALGSVES